MYATLIYVHHLSYFYKIHISNLDLSKIFLRFSPFFGTLVSLTLNNVVKVFIFEK